MTGIFFSVRMMLSDSCGGDIFERASNSMAVSGNVIGIKVDRSVLSEHVGVQHHEDATIIGVLLKWHR